jgi:hypothetical protein
MALSCRNEREQKKRTDPQHAAITVDERKNTAGVLLTENKNMQRGGSDSVDLSAVPTTNESKTNTKIKFNELVIVVNGMAIFDAEKMERIQKDTAEIEAEVGETIEGRTISISSEQLIGLNIEQRYETSVTIMNEGPHCDLIDWKHFNSGWNSLKQNSSGQFVGDKYTEQDYTIFPEVSMDELKQTVKELCGEDWFKLLEKTNSPLEYPCTVNISRYFLRITGKRKDNGQKVTKLIIIKTPMGC